MKYLIVMTTSILLGALAGFSTQGFAKTSDDKMATENVLRLSEPVASNADSETFGALLDTSLPKVTLHALSSKSAAYLDKRFQLDTKVAQVCQKKGCFFIAQQGEDVMRVAFKDYGFFVPTDSAGKTVTLAATLVKKQMTAEQVAHFNKDMQGDSDAVKEGVVYEILAESVTIPKA